MDCYDVDANVITQISSEELLPLLVSVARRYPSGHIRHCLLIVFSMLERTLQMLILYYIDYY